MTSPYYKDPIIINATATGQCGHVMTDHLMIMHIVHTTLAEAPSVVEIVKDLMQALCIKR